MDLLPILLTAHQGAWRAFVARKQNKAFEKIKQTILQRDNNTCRYCGFESQKYMEITNFDHNYSNNAAQNLVTTCSFCAQCFFLESIDLDDKMGGRIVYLPEISQAALNNFCRVLFCAMDKDTAYKGKLQSVYLSLTDRCKEVEICFGPGSSNPATFGQGLIDSMLEEDKLHHNVMHSLRLLPSRKQFKAQIDYWKESVFANLPL